MPRRARVVTLGVPHHITHRGNRRGDLFFESEDRDKYMDFLEEYSERYKLLLWAYCLMTNHVHLLGVPEEEDSMANAIRVTHGRFARHQNDKYRWDGHLWANRYFSTPLDEEHLWAAVRYVELNPGRAGLVKRAEDYPWSSARAHAAGRVDPLLSANRPFPGTVECWSKWLAEGVSDEILERLRRNTQTGRPSGSADFAARLRKKSE